MPDSVQASPPSFMVPEKATSAFHAWPFSARQASRASLVRTACRRERVTTIALARPSMAAATCAAKCSTQMATFSPMACGCSSTNALSRYSAFAPVIARVVLATRW